MAKSQGGYTLIVVAVIGLVGAIIAAAATVVAPLIAKEREIQATRTAELDRTAVANAGIQATNTAPPAAATQLVVAATATDAPIVPMAVEPTAVARMDTARATATPVAVIAIDTPIVAPAATEPSPQVLTLAPGVTMQMVRVPAGKFIMGSTDQDIDAIMKECSGCSADDRKYLENQKPQHTVDLAEYWIGKYEVTNAQYAAFAAATQRDWKAPEGKADHPVVNMSWDDAVAFCKWASEASGQVLRLPTESEWEKAARGTDGRAYPWGDDPIDKTLANFDRNENGTTPVGKYSPQGDSPYGAADMAGNVWEVRHEVA